MSCKSPLITFNNGEKYPVIGLGTSGPKGDEVMRAVKDAVDAGYRHFDCALLYGNEKEIGRALKEKMEQGVVKREDLYITSKLWNNAHRKDLVEPSIRKSLSNLGLDYLDLYLIHWPMGYKEGEDPFPVDEDGWRAASETSFTETWPVMEELVKKGLTKSIGISNFNSEQVKQIIDICTIKPVVNQVESHIYLNQTKLSEFCKQYGIVMTAYSPLGSPGREGVKISPLKEPKVVAIAEKHNKSPAQILIKFQVQRGFIAIPKSVTKSRIEANKDIFDFTLTDDDMKELTSLNRNERIFTLDRDKKHKDYPFALEF